MLSDPLIPESRKEQRISLPSARKKKKRSTSDDDLNGAFRDHDDNATASTEREEAKIPTKTANWARVDGGPMTPRINQYMDRVHIEDNYSYRAWFWICLSVRATKYRKVATFWPSRIFEIFIASVILANVGVAVWAISADDDHERDILKLPIFWVIECVTIISFMSEYCLRLWSCVEDVKLRERSPCVARLLWAVKPLSLLDLFCFLLIAAAVPNYFSGVNNVSLDRSVLELRVLVLLRFERQLKALGRLKMIIGAEVRELALAGFFTLCLTVYCGVVFYFVEKTEDDTMTMGTAIWWGVQTITSLGYGTVLPKTVTGKILSGILALLGLIAFAIPAGIISSRFSLIAEEEARQRAAEEEEAEFEGEYFEDELVRAVASNASSSRRRRRSSAERRSSRSPRRSPRRTSAGELSELRKEIHILRAKVRILSGLLEKIHDETRGGGDDDNARIEY